MDNSVIIKGNKHGIVVVMDENIPFAELKVSLAEKFRSASKFFDKANMAVTFEGRKLTQDEEKEILDIIAENSELNIICVVDNDKLRDDYYKKAVDKCYDLLSRRDHSVKELKTKLLRTVDEENADKAIEKMIDYGYLDDEKYAKNLVKYLSETKRMSRNHIKQEMYKRGVPNDIIAYTLEETEIDNVSAVVDLIFTKYRNKLDAQDGNKKVIAALMRKGFSYSDIREAFDRIENEEYD